MALKEEGGWGERGGHPLISIVYKIFFLFLTLLF